MIKIILTDKTKEDLQSFLLKNTTLKDPFNDLCNEFGFSKIGSFLNHAFNLFFSENSYMCLIKNHNLKFSSYFEKDYQDLLKDKRFKNLLVDFETVLSNEISKEQNKYTEYSDMSDLLFEIRRFVKRNSGGAGEKKS